MSIAANRFKNVRAALIHNLDCASKCREHNNSNVLCLGSWISTPIAVDQILDQWIETSFGEGRHVKRIEKMSGQNKPETIVFTNGCFDILHVGHVQTLEFAKSLGGKLIVAINSDRSVREIKGYDRPINGENDRKKILESMSAVDEVVIFGETEPNKIMLQSQPDIVVKGGDYTVAELRERDSIPDHIDIKTAPLINKELYSTTTVVDKIRNNA
jgi:rfaE bifunctional protein nucleotidyltransferase chain/domain